MANRKPRSDSRLKTMDEEEQEALWDFLGDGTYTEGVKFCRDVLGEKTNRTSVGDWWQWYSLNLRSEEMDSALKAATDILKDQTDLPIDQIEKLADTIMFTDAWQKGNVKAYAMMKQLRQNDRRLDQGDRDLTRKDKRLALMKRKYDDAQKAKVAIEKTISSDRGMSEETRRAIREELGMI